MRAPAQRPGGGRHVALYHQRFTDKEAIGAGLGHAGKVVRGLQSAFADDDPPGRHQRRQPFGGGNVRYQAFKVAVVDANKVRLEFEGTLQFGLAVDLDKDIHAVIHGGAFKFPGLAVVQDRHDQ